MGGACAPRKRGASSRSSARLNCLRGLRGLQGAPCPLDSGIDGLAQVGLPELIDELLVAGNVPGRLSKGSAREGRGWQGINRARRYC
eukprot:4115785-Pyramimonas_sp.AAC.1